VVEVVTELKIQERTRLLHRSHTLKHGSNWSELECCHQETYAYYAYSSKPLVSSSIEIKINNRFSVGWKTSWNPCWVHHDWKYDWKCGIYFRSCAVWSSPTHLFLGILEAESCSSAPKGRFDAVKVKQKEWRFNWWI